MATKTTLGWIIHGRIEEMNTKQNEYTFHVFEKQSDINLHELVQRSFTLDSFGISSNSKSDPSEERAIDVMTKTAKRVGDKFEIGLLWKEKNMTLPESKTNAFHRLQYIERKMKTDAKYKEAYCKKIDTYIEKGYLRKLSSEEAKKRDPKCWYLPHFGVSTVNKPKLRLVMDAAAKSHGLSLNDHLLPGPDLLQSLIGVLIRFREKKIAFCADIREMFHQVRIRKEDQCAQRLLWRDGDARKPVDVYEMQVMTFGATCSPACAQFIKNLNAKEQAPSKKIVSAIIDKHYVDDYLDCEDSIDEALETIAEVRRVQLLGGFDLVNWNSNSEKIMQALTQNENFCKNLNLNCQTNLQRVLGIWWNAKTDNFQYQVKIDSSISHELHQPTKREILKTVMSIFDPLGLISHFTVRGRILLQEVWRKGTGWDEKVDDEIFVEWQEWINDLNLLISNLQIPRCYSMNLTIAGRVEIHIFCDASKQAFATVTYLLTEFRNKIEISLIFAKAKVTPMKALSIPRLELQAAVMAGRIFQNLKKYLTPAITKNYFWSDSTTVLHWLRSDGRKLGQFESHRVGEIQENTNIQDWKWVPTNQNPADFATRSKDARKNVNEPEMWFRGPEFLYRCKEEWPESKVKFEEIEELPSESESKVKSKEAETTKVILHISISKIGLPEIEKFSSFTRLIRTTAWLLRFINKTRCKTDISTKYLTRQEYINAEVIWIKLTQIESFSEEIETLKKKNRNLKKHSRLRQLTPELKDDVMVLGGRTNFSTFMSTSTKSPYILPPKHHFTRLLIKHYHEIYGHQGIQTVLNQLRQKYWIINGREAVKTCFRNCNKCKLRKNMPTMPLMGQLPPERLKPFVKPFSFVGVDYFGPIKVTVGRRSEKRWGVLFICMTLRAVHLEVAHSLSADSAIMALRRLICRRGIPLTIFSDNGTNFRGANEELRKAVEKFNFEKSAEVASAKQIDWKFIPPAAPHMGGSWERLIKSIKITFYNILKEKQLKDELLLTLFLEVELIINSRPLTYVSSDPEDYEALTPNHFIFSGPPEDNVLFHNLNSDFLRKEWQKSQNIACQFWRRWIKEYLPTLSKRSNWYDDVTPIKEGEIVIIIDDALPRNKWKLGKITTTIPGPDSRIRVVDVRTSDGSIFRRPLSKICRLELSDQ